jgi:hypothetical protein
VPNGCADSSPQKQREMNMAHMWTITVREKQKQGPLKEEYPTPINKLKIQ